SRDEVVKKNGVAIISSRGLAGGEYQRVKVTPLMVTVENISLDRPEKAEPVASLNASVRKSPSVFRAFWDDDNNPFLARRHPAATLAPRAITDNPELEKGEYRINQGEWQPMTRDDRDF